MERSVAGIEDVASLAAASGKTRRFSNLEAAGEWLGNLLLVWHCVSKYIEGTLRNRKTFSRLPGWSPDKSDRDTRETCPLETFNFTALANLSATTDAFSRTEISLALRDLVASMLKLAKSGRGLALSFGRIGKLHVGNGEVRMKFYPEFVKGLSDDGAVELAIREKDRDSDGYKEKGDKGERTGRPNTPTDKTEESPENCTAADDKSRPSPSPSPIPEEDASDTLICGTPDSDDGVDEDEDPSAVIYLELPPQQRNTNPPPSSKHTVHFPPAPQVASLTSSYASTRAPSPTAEQLPNLTTTGISMLPKVEHSPHSVVAAVPSSSVPSSSPNSRLTSVAQAVALVQQLNLPPHIAQQLLPTGVHLADYFTPLAMTEASTAGATLGRTSPAPPPVHLNHILFRRTKEDYHTHAPSGDRLWSNAHCPICRQGKSEFADAREDEKRRERERDVGLMELGLEKERRLQAVEKECEIAKLREAIANAKLNYEWAIEKARKRDPPPAVPMGDLFEKRTLPSEHVVDKTLLTDCLLYQIYEKESAREREKLEREAENRIFNQTFLQQFRTQETEAQLTRMRTREKQQRTLAEQAKMHQALKNKEMQDKSEANPQNLFARDESPEASRQRAAAKKLYEEQLVLVKQKKEAERRLADLETMGGLEKLSWTRKEYVVFIHCFDGPRKINSKRNRLAKDLQRVQKERFEARKSLELYWKDQIRKRQEMLLEF
ncbi:hypothetical protein HDU93_006263 [Gonapodya sp. JEL0774]|nr:hypothetical protein HDU93_006263 [Gonapodya sp. JEL0774]